MTLPTPRQSVRDEAVYPDLIRIRFQYRFNSVVQSLPLYQGLIDAACGGLRFSRAPFGVSGRLPDIPGIPDFTAKFTKRRELLQVLISFSPLVALHWRASSAEMPTCANVRNWLPASSVRANNEFVLDRACDDLEEIRSRIDAFLTEVRVGAIELQELISLQPWMFISSVELAYDVGTRDPHALVHDCRAPLISLLRPYREHYYAMAQRVEGVDENSVMLSGYMRAGERLKVYTKTDRRVRIELSWNSSALARAVPTQDRSLGSHRLGRLEFLDRRHLRERLGTLAGAAAATFQSVLTGRASIRRRGVSVSDFLGEIFGRIRDFERARAVCALLIENRSFTAGELRFAREALLHRKPALIEPAPSSADLATQETRRSRRGYSFYRLCPRFSAAADFLRQHPEWLRPFLQLVVTLLKHHEGEGRA